MEGLTEIESCDAQFSCFYSLKYSDNLIVWKVVSEMNDCAESISRSSVDGSDTISRPTMIHRYTISTETILAASKLFQPIVRLDTSYIIFPHILTDIVIMMRFRGFPFSIFRVQFPQKLRYHQKQKGMKPSVRRKL